MKNQILVIFILLMGISACSNTPDNTSICDQTTVISATQYVNAPNDHLTINSLEINGDCILISFGASGCSGDTWKVDLVDSGNILESFPPQRNLRLSLENKELCQAYFIKELTFDISNLQVEGNQVILNISNSEESVLYKY